MHTPCRRRRTDQGPVPAVEPARLHCVAIAVLMKLTPPSPAGSVTGWCSIWGMCSRTTTGGGVTNLHNAEENGGTADMRDFLAKCSVLLQRSASLLFSGKPCRVAS